MFSVVFSVCGRRDGAKYVSMGCSGFVMGALGFTK